jgi:hypothetical protein
VYLIRLGPETVLGRGQAARPRARAGAPSQPPPLGRGLSTAGKPLPHHDPLHSLPPPTPSLPLSLLFASRPFWNMFVVFKFRVNAGAGPEPLACASEPPPGTSRSPPTAQWTPGRGSTARARAGEPRWPRKLTRMLPSGGLKISESIMTGPCGCRPAGGLRVVPGPVDGPAAAAPAGGPGALVSPWPRRRPPAPRLP